MTLPTSLNYPIIAIADLHGQLDQLKRLVTRLEMVSEWDDCALVFLGDFVDRGEDVPGTIDLVLDLLSRRPGGSAILGNHDLALVRAARLDDGPPSPYWIESYLRRYDHDQTFLGYLGRSTESWWGSVGEGSGGIEGSDPSRAPGVPRLVALGGRVARSLVLALRAVVRVSGKCDGAACGSASQGMGPLGHEACLGLRTQIGNGSLSTLSGSVPTKTCRNRPWGFRARFRSRVTSRSRSLT